MTKLERKLRDLGCRVEGNFTLHSGNYSPVKWDIKKLFVYPPWIVEEALREFIWDIGKVQPLCIVGIPIGGKLLAKVIAEKLGYTYGVFGDNYVWLNGKPNGKEIILIDDVITTGNTIKEVVPLVSPTLVAVLVNRSSLTEIDGIPIVSGFFADEVKV